MPDPGGSPIKYSLVAPTAPAPPVALYIPEAVTEAATPEQLIRIAVIELEFAQRVAKEMSKAYADVLTVLRGKKED